MKQLQFALLLSIANIIVLSAQDCPPSETTFGYSISFSSQEEIDMFSIAYPDCTLPNGTITIEGNDITNLDGLAGFDGNYGFYISNNPLLQNIDGLSGLQSIGGTFIENNPSLTSIAGFSNVSSSWDFILRNNDALTSLNGLQNLETANSEWEISGNELLSDISAFEFLDISNSQYLGIYNNPSLSCCDHFPFCEEQLSPPHPLEIHSNAPGCSSVTEILVACNSEEPGGTTVGIDDIQSNDLIQVFPNPAFEMLMASSRLQTEIGESRFRLFDVSGRLILDLPFENLFSGISIQQLNEGLYYFGVLDLHGNTISTGQVLIE